MKTQKAFVAYRHTGEDPEVLNKQMNAVRKGLEKAGLDFHCTYFEEDEFQDRKMSARQIMEHAFETLDSCTFLLVILSSEEKNEGMLMEIGYCIAKKIPIVVVIASDVKTTYVPQMANTVIEWQTYSELETQLAELTI